MKTEDIKNLIVEAAGISLEDIDADLEFSHSEKIWLKHKELNHGTWINRKYPDEIQKRGIKEYINRACSKLESPEFSPSHEDGCSA